ncbi:MAG TPA: MarR family transcriptional regulator [Paucimonas sp.]|nr:MarR family transcriptional regulator [Paucimonas sp.]
MKEPYLRSVRLLAECYHAFEQMSGAGMRRAGLTPSQFDIIATLGNTPGMSCKELGEKTLITKGTLTGVLDRLEARGLVQRVTQSQDRRSTAIRLTAQGEKEFERVFKPHVDYCKQPFQGYSASDFAALEQALAKLKMHLEAALERPAA